MFQVGQTIFAGQQWTVLSGDKMPHMVHSGISVECYSIQGKRGSIAMLVRQIDESGRPSRWELIRNGRVSHVEVHPG